MLFWVILAVFAALPMVMQPQEKAQLTPDPGPSPTRTGRRRVSRVPHQNNNLDLPTVLRLVVVAWAVGGILALTWVKAVSYPRAAIAASQGIAQFNQGNYQTSLASLNRAIRLAPDVPVYYGGIAAIYTAYLQNPQVPPEAECSLELDAIPYRDCLVRQVHLNNVLASEQRPFDWRSRLSRANSALALGLNDEAVRLYREVVDLVPAAWPLHNRLAEAYIDIGEPELALMVLEDSLAITGDTGQSTQAQELQILARKDLELTQETSPGTEANQVSPEN
jgi:tetratricopeptide (TPR) repeat protein